MPPTNQLITQNTGLLSRVTAEQAAAAQAQAAGVKTALDETVRGIVRNAAGGRGVTLTEPERARLLGTGEAAAQTAQAQADLTGTELGGLTTRLVSRTQQAGLDFSDAERARAQERGLLARAQEAELASTQADLASRERLAREAGQTDLQVAQVRNTRARQAAAAEQAAAQSIKYGITQNDKKQLRFVNSLGETLTPLEYAQATGTKVTDVLKIIATRAKSDNIRNLAAGFHQQLQLGNEKQQAEWIKRYMSNPVFRQVLLSESTWR